jgi:hypothetical protein
VGGGLTGRNYSHRQFGRASVECFVTNTSSVSRNFFRGGGSTNSVEDRKNGDLGAVAP